MVYTAHMTKLLQEAIARVAVLPADEQNRAAEALLAFAADNRPYTLTPEQLAGVDHAIEQADRGDFATEADIRDIFGRAL